MTDDDLAAALTGGKPMAGPDGAPLARRCKAGRLLDTVSPANRATILDHLYGDTTDVDLSHMLETGGHRVAPSSLSNHRRGACICNHRNADEPIERIR